MGYKKGVVDGINLKQEREGQYGKFAGYGIKIGDEWFNGVASTVKSLGRVAVIDKNYNEIKQGMEIEFMYSTNDKGFNDIDKKTLLALSAGGTSQPLQSNNVPQVAQSITTVGNVAKNDSDAIVRSNCLVAAMIKAYGSLSPEKFKELDMDMFYRAADGYVEYCKNGRK